MTTTYDGLRAVVIGAARSGRGAVRVLAARGARVTVVEQRPDAAREADWPASVELRCGAGATAALDGVDLIVPSPGVPRQHPMLQDAVARGIPVWSEIELAARLLDCPVLAVTGTNGKSTTTVLVGNMLRAAGQRVFVGGNLGTPLTEAVGSGDAWDAAVAEVSSFQLEWVPSFRPRVAVLLNLTPDHQDRYADLADYGAAKANLLAHQESGDYAVLNRDDAWVWAQRRATRATVLSFGRDAVEFGTFLDGDDVVVWGAGQPQRYALGESPLSGAHNRENLLAAITAASAWGVPSDAIRAGMRQTAGLPHRLTRVRERDGIAWYDDSKATNVGAAVTALTGLAEPKGVLIAGGRDKFGAYEALVQALVERGRGAVLLGEAAERLERAIGGRVPVVREASLAGAVHAALGLARPGDAVLLSPACSSFDMFTSYAERGRLFAEAVRNLQASEEAEQ
jgi:UDP-N-acetylmuramoylalanine--D-glutamate ligase